MWSHLGTTRESWRISNRVPSRVATTKREKSTWVSYLNATGADVIIPGDVKMGSVTTVAKWDTTGKRVGVRRSVERKEKEKIRDVTTAGI